MGVPPNWMGFDRKSHLEMDDDWGYPYDETETTIWTIYLLKDGDPLKRKFRALVTSGGRIGLL